MNRDRFVSFQIPIYRWKVRVVITDDMKRWAEQYKREGESCEQTLAFFVPIQDTKTLLIVIQPSSPLHYIDHEIGHAARHVMHYIGFQITENDEPLAYLEEYMTMKIHQGINKLGPDKKKVDKKKEVK